MTTRYTVNMADRIIEPDESGQWVKHKDYAHMESSIEGRVEAGVAEGMGEKMAELTAQAEQIATLTAANERLWADLSAQKERADTLIDKQTRLIDAAKDRLELLGHAPTCQSRYGTMTADGTEFNGRCNCGLDEWFRESGVAYG